MEENLNQQNWGSADNSGRPMPPPPPPPEITLRTMQSDIESIKQSGGENPMPKPFTPPEISAQGGSASGGKKQNNMELEDLSREEGMIKPSNGDGVLPPSEPPKKKLKIFILIAILILVIAGAVFAGYKWIYPMFKPAIVVPQEQPAAVVPEAVVQTPEPEVLPPVEELTPVVVPEVIPTPEPIVLKQHISLLVSSADSLVSLTLSVPASLLSIKELLTAEAANKPSTTTSLKEAVLSDQGGQLVFSDILSMFLPALTSAETVPLFEEDFTSVIFYDSNGAWLGMIAKLKEGADAATAKTLISKLEQSADLAKLYIQDPGTQAAAGFKDGKANNLSLRYLSFAKTGASLNYGWTSNNLLVISTSYNGVKAMLTKLGVQ